jgi:hypothetical protein
LQNVLFDLSLGHLHVCWQAGHLDLGFYFNFKFL